MDIESNFRESAKLRTTAKENTNKQYKEDSENRLKESIERKFRTTFIGALSAFEEEFGYLWGRGLPLNKLTDAEHQERLAWDRVRTNVLNNGNNQMRAAHDEISQHSIERDKYRVSLKPKV